jgi:hypothetical protein
MLSKFDIEPRRNNIRNVAAQRYLYSPVNSRGSRDFSVDYELSKLESTLSSIWSKVTTGFIDIYGDEDYRRAVSLFVSTLLLRHPKSLRDVEFIHKQLVAFLDQIPKDENGDPLINEIEIDGVIQKCDYSDFNEYKSLGEDGIKRLFVDNIRYAMEFAEILMEKRWVIVFSEDPIFITSDNPVVLENIFQSPFGISTPGTMLFFPLTPTRILMMNDQTDQPSGHYFPLEQLNLTPSHVNFLLWRNCERFIFSPRRTDQVFAEICESAYLHATGRDTH